MRKSLSYMFVVLTVMSMILAACAAPATPAVTEAPATEAVVTEAPATEAPTQVATEAATEAATGDFVFGLLLVGPYNDRGYSQAHYEAGQYVEKNLPGSKMIYLDKVNPADRPGTTPDQLGEELVSQGAKLVVFNSDDMKDAATTFAKANPDISVIMASGDQVWKEGKAYEDIPNMVNIMGRMEYGKMMAGCAAALTTKTGQIGYLGPLINDETRRLASSAYLGARYCWEKYAGKDPADLKFKVTWIGFWFNIPGFTSDPTQVANDFINSGHDVIISGIDTTEGLTEAKKASDAGKEIYAVPYDFIGSCEEGASVCLGVPYFNWGPAYLQTIKAAKDGTFKSEFQWNGPDWSDINNVDTSAVGFVKGDALSADASAKLDEFIAALAGGLNLWTGPINLQDGTVYLADGEVATDQQIWYLPQLLEGMEGQSVPQ
jgi:simple sugar transport system substrate-binding protein